MKIYDMVIVGGGPGGYTAALYAARAGLDVILTVSEVEVKANASGENSQPLEPVVIEKICFVTKK